MNPNHHLPLSLEVRLFAARQERRQREAERRRREAEVAADPPLAKLVEKARRGLPELSADDVRPELVRLAARARGRGGTTRGRRRALVVRPADGLVLTAAGERIPGARVLDDGAIAYAGRILRAARPRAARA